MNHYRDSQLLFSCCSIFMRNSILVFQSWTYTQTPKFSKQVVPSQPPAGRGRNGASMCGHSPREFKQGTPLPLCLPTRSHSCLCATICRFICCVTQQHSGWKFSLASPPKPRPCAWELFQPFSCSAHQSFPKQHPTGASLGKDWNSWAFAFV